MKSKLSILAALFLGNSYISNAQSAKDAFLISHEYNGGTARFKGLGNANTALGGDISSITGNPAGLGFFGQSDFSFSTNFLASKNNSTYFGNKNSSTKNNFSLDNAGVVFHIPSYRHGGNLEKGWINFNIGASYNRVNNYTNNLLYFGKNNSSTIVQSYTDQMRYDKGWEEIFKNSNLVDQYANANDGYFPLTESNYEKEHTSKMIEGGFKSRSNISFGANYSNKFYIGLGIGFTSYKYDLKKEFTEEGLTRLAVDVIKDNPNSDYSNPTMPLKNRFLDKDYLLFDDYNLSSRGSGLDFKLGFIYKPSTDWNIGLTLQSPTWMTVSDDLYEKKETNWYADKIVKDPFATFKDEYDPISEYKIQTPVRLSIGTTKFFNSGLITAEAELVDYGSTKVTYIGHGFERDQQIMNDNIKDAYRTVVNAKLGGEMLFNSILSGRAGFNYYGNPYKNADQTQYSGSAGLGFKLNRSVYLDIALIHSITQYSDSPYTLDRVWNTPNPTADIKLNRTNAVLTLGAKF